MSGRKARSAWVTGLAATTVAAGLLAAAPAGAATGDEVKNGAYAYTVKLDVEGERSCSGALVDPQWVLTAGGCFSGDAGQGASLAAGKPAKKTTAIVGRSDLSTGTGLATDIVELAPYKGRDLVLARLAQPATGVTPASLSTVAPSEGDTIKAAGFGRTGTVWAPDTVHTAAFTVDAVDAGSLSLTGKTADNALCKGDTGGPVVRERDGRTELIGIATRSWQGGCLGTDPGEKRTGAVASRTDDVGAWMRTTIAATTMIQGAGSGRCLDMPGETSGTSPFIWNCWGGNNQKWTYTADKELRVFGDKCLDAARGGTTPDTPLIIHPCNGGDNQKWNLNKDGSISGVPSGLCVDVGREATDNGSAVGLWYCNGGSNQKWTRV